MKDKAKIFSTTFTDEELKGAMRDVTEDLEMALRMGMPASARKQHIFRTALRRWINQRAECAQKKGQS